MASLTGSSIASTYKDLLQVSNSNSGIDGTARVVSDGEDTASKLFLDTNRVGVGIAPTDGTLHVHTATAGSVDAPSVSNDLIVENNDNAGITILTPDDKMGTIGFGSPSDSIAGMVRYDETNKTMIFGTVEDTSAGNIKFITANEVTALTIDSSQNATFSGNLTVTTGINFPDDASASPSSDVNTLDNYEEGVFEVAVTGGTSGSWSTSSSGGYLNYVKIGKLCHISGYIEVDTDNSASGLVKITLPFTSATGLTEASDLQWGSASVADGGTTLNAVVSGAYIPENQAYFHLYHVTDAGAYTYYSDSNLDAVWVARVGFTYRTNN
tara:strand:+ start:6572 stop:7546 length:975 start_codon:yes stop_codon:yes gene_type:complete